MGQTSYQRQKVVRQLEWLRSLKSVPCFDCDGSYPWYVMTFDHLPERGPKLPTLGHTQRGRFSWAKLRAEVEKCVVVCANCQAIRTFKRANKIPF
jgi:hypothetical protein